MLATHKNMNVSAIEFVAVLDDVENHELIKSNLKK
jgi:hypothetical protein